MYSNGAAYPRSMHSDSFSVVHIHVIPRRLDPPARHTGKPFCGL